MQVASGPAGRLAESFIHSKLTPLLIIASLALGAFSVLALPREEEPQIIVPMIDVFVDVPGADPAEVEQRVTRPLEKLLWEIPGVEYLYSTSSPGRSMVVVRFYVGQDEDRRSFDSIRRSPRTWTGSRSGSPHMRPLPVGASAAMLFSLAVAFIVTPWAAVRLLPTDGEHGPHTEDRFTLF